MGLGRATDVGQRKIALVLEYDGTRYHGFQSQINATSIQDELERSISRLSGERTRVGGAGRTDAGVHATGQVVTFHTTAPYPAATFVRALNHYLPDDIAVRASYEVELCFDPRRDALARVYRYAILNRERRSPVLRWYTHHVPLKLNLDAMTCALDYLACGPRDFIPFSGKLGRIRTTVRHLYRTAVWRQDEMVLLEVEGNAFLPQQVRRLAGAVMRVGTGYLSMYNFRELADCGRQGAAGWVLPPQGLCMVEVKYRNFPPR